MSAHRWRLPTAALLSVSLLLPAVATATPDRVEKSTIVGANGHVYDAAPPVLRGRHGDLFYGLAFDLFCSGAGPELRSGMNRLSKLAKVIRASGRQVVFTVVPDKSLVNGRNVVRSRLPHGRCDKVGMEQQGKILDVFRDRSYLPLRKGLKAEKHQTYWKTDVHWDTIGAAVYAKLLATRLDPALGARQRYRPGAPQTAVGALNQMQGVDTPETVPSRRSATRVKVTPVPGTDSLHQRFPFDHAWTSTPAGLTYPGRALLIGDSFTQIGLPNLRPLFGRGRFLWVANVEDSTIVKAIKRSDTVVIEVVQFFTNLSPLGRKGFRDAVRRALR